MKLSIDVGGTFTDLVLLDEANSRVLVDKVPSTPDSGAGVINGIQRVLARAGAEPSDLERIFHGFTIATNAWLTRSGARVCLVVTAGFGDLLEIGNQQRSDIYDLAVRKPKPLVPRSRVIEVAERMGAFGEIVTPLTEAELHDCVAAVVATQPEAVAISLLFGFVNSSHEDQLRAALAAALPEIPIYLASQVNPQLEEFPRANTTVAAAYLGPKVATYTHALATELKAFNIEAPLLYMRSDGGAATVEAACDNPASMLLSGPAGGVLASLELARAAQAENVITFDMGGTSADFCAIANGQVAIDRERWIDGLPLRVPMLDIKTISAGGGSIATVDLGGALRVGPASAGAEPGPACYGHGGTKATVTDAAVVTGLLSPAMFAGGDLPLQPQLARDAIFTHVADPLGLTIEEAAFGVLAVASANMGEAIREITVERGFKLSEFALLSFGGAGGLFAPFLLDELNLNECLIPVHPGVFAAHGLHFADLRHHAQRAYPCPVSETSVSALDLVAEEMVTELQQQLERDNVPLNRRQFQLSADMRYIGQYHELNVPIGDALDHAASYRPTLGQQFHAVHEQRFGYHDANGPAEIVNLRCEGIGRMHHPQFRPAETLDNCQARRTGARSIYLGTRIGEVDASVYHRASLNPGSAITGPAIIEQSDSTLVVLPDQQVQVDKFAFIHLSRINLASC